MSAAVRLLLLGGALAMIAGCTKHEDQQAAATNSAGPVEIETLPSDESDATPADELANGDDEADADNSMASANTDAVQD